MKITTICRSTFVLAGFLSLALVANATPVINLVINENSSTSLTYSWQGGALQTVTATTPDHWTFAIMDDVVTPISSLQNVYVQWKEPEYANNGEVNLVNFYQYGPAANGTTITVISDTSAGGYPLEDNGQTYSFNPPIPSGNTVQFNDNGDNGVPDGGVTASLLGMSLVAVGALRRKLS